MLMVLNNINSVRALLPPGLSIMSESKGSWLLMFLYGCMIFCFATLVEYGLVHYALSAKAAEDKKRPLPITVDPASPNQVRIDGSGLAVSATLGGEAAPAEAQPEPPSIGASIMARAIVSPRTELALFAAQRLTTLDEVCRWLFPMAFFIFVIAMLIVYHAGPDALADYEF